MTLLVPNQGEAIALKALLNHTAPQNLDLRLYSSNTTPGDTDTEATYTEVSGFGYAAIQLTASGWVVTAGDPTSAAYPEQTFTFTGAAGNVYGYYITQRTSGYLVWAERFADGPYNVANNGDTAKITPVITLSAKQ